jgi:RES domain-containing protein
MREAGRSQPPELCFRITRRPYADLTGEGARIVGGRWNSQRLPAVYLAEEPALAVLETLVHLDLPPDLIPKDYVLMQVRFGPGLPVDGSWLEEGATLPPDDDACRKVGDEFLRARRAVALRVPSVIVPFSRNVILNPLHPMISHVTIQAVDNFAFDRRLLGRE